MRILALDLAKNKSVYLDYGTAGGERSFGKLATNAVELEKLLLRCRPDRVVIEACPAAGRSTPTVRMELALVEQLNRPADLRLNSPNAAALNRRFN